LYEFLNLDLSKYKFWSVWCERIDSKLLKSMDSKEIELQERWFEIYRTEVSYNKNLKLLKDLIMYECKTVLTNYDFNSIFTDSISIFINLSNK
jgi:hypothetical protein